MNLTRRTVRLTAIPIALAILLTVAPCASAVARAQTESADENEKGKDQRVRPRSGLGWTGIGLASAGGLLILGSFTFNDSKGCGFFNEQSCSSVGRVYGVTGGTMVFTGLTLLVMDENRRYPKLPRPARQTAIGIGPRAIQVRMLF